MQAKKFCVFFFLFNLGLFPVYGSEEKELSPLCGVESSEEWHIDEKGYVEVGGIKQWVTIKGDSCENPVVLFIHGGPGNTLSLYSENIYREWESSFTIVQWDQRGAGKTFEANQELGELTIEKLNRTELTLNLMVRDGLDLTHYLLQRLSKEKIIITGGSWGSVLAIKMIAEQPENYHFYVGLSQLVNSERNSLRSYQAVLKKSEKC